MTSEAFTIREAFKPIILSELGLNTRQAGKFCARAAKRGSKSSAFRFERAGKKVHNAQLWWIVETNGLPKNPVENAAHALDKLVKTQSIVDEMLEQTSRDFDALIAWADLPVEDQRALVEELRPRLQTRREQIRKLIPECEGLESKTVRCLHACIEYLERRR